MHPQSTLPVAIRFINVKKHFKDRDVEALDGIDLEVAQGEFFPSSALRDRERARFLNSGRYRR